MEKPTQQWENRIGRRLRLRDLHILSAVAQSGSMAKAARHLAMSQPAVSEAIANLEHVLHYRLFDRTSRGIAPTLYAHALLKCSNVVFDELQQGIKALEHLADPARGEVQIGAGELSVSGLLPAVIDQLSRRHPKIIVRVHQVSTSTLDFPELRERKFDLTLARISGPFDKSDLNIELLFDDPFRVVVGTRSRWARRRDVSLAQLVNESWILVPNQVMSAHINEAFGAQGLEVPKERVHAGSYLMRMHLLETGRFVSVLANSVLRYNTKRWSLKALPIDFDPNPLPIGLVTLQNRTVSPAVQLFIENLRAVAKTLVVPAKSRT
jgi:DNA-binding transcriptional LysR family regulator